MKKTVPFIWSNDDISIGKSHWLREMRELLDPLGIKGDFFTIPEGRGIGPIDDDKEFMKEIESARNAGHCFHQHGHIHTAFESGVPLLWMLDFSEGARTHYDTHRFGLESRHTVEALTEMLEKGRKIWRRAMGEEPKGYRPGWGATCTNLVTALGSLGFEWSSFTLPTPTSWVWGQERWDYEWKIQEGALGEPLQAGKLMEFPIIGDYGFRVPNEADKIDRMVELAKKEFLYFHERDWPVVLVSHPHGLERNENSGYAVHKKLLPWVLESGLFEPMTLPELYERRKADPRPLPDLFANQGPDSNLG